MGLAGEPHEPRIDLGRHDNRHVDTAVGCRNECSEQRFVGHEIRCRQDNLVARGVDGHQQDFGDRAGPHGGSGRYHLNGRRATWLQRPDVAGFGKPLDTFARLQFPVFQKGDGEPLDGRTADSHHGIDPLAHSRVLLEEPRVDHVEAPRIRDLAVDDDNLPVQSQVETDE